MLLYIQNTKYRVKTEKRGDFMYRNLKSELVKTGMTAKDFSKLMGISYGQILKKLNGTYPFTLDEAFRAKEVLHTNTAVEELFTRAS